jgi:hypothetical protein
MVQQIVLCANEAQVLMLMLLEALGSLAERRRLLSQSIKKVSSGGRTASSRPYRGTQVQDWPQGEVLGMGPQWVHNHSVRYR